MSAAATKSENKTDNMRTPEQQVRRAEQTVQDDNRCEV